MFDPKLHEKLIEKEWSEDIAQAIIEDIVNKTILEFRGEQFWPAHPDLKETFGFVSPVINIWHGAAGSIWAIDYLTKLDPALTQFDFTPYLSNLELQNKISLKEYPKNLQIDPNSIGYLLGNTGVLLLKWKLTQDTKYFEQIIQEIEVNITNPANELMWAAPGTMLIAWFLYTATKDNRCRELFKRSADYLFATWSYNKELDCHLWSQDMYGSITQYLAIIHGFSGNIFALMKVYPDLDKKQQQTLIDKATDTFVKTAVVNEKYANWPMDVATNTPETRKLLLQLCHGAPGILIGLAELYPYMDNSAKEIFHKAVQLIWDAGPLVKPWGLCHGTAGNGYVFLKYYHLTRDSIWLERARRFAMHAISQSQAMENKYQCIRSDNWCGDLGLAIYLRDCIDETAKFPLLDYC